MPESGQRTAPQWPLGSTRRSLTLLQAFRREQSDPAFFYRTLAMDSVGLLMQYAQLQDALVLDVGGGPGFFREAFGAAGARYATVDADAGELSAAGQPGPNTVLGSGTALPVADDSVDIAFSSNVLEHVAAPWTMAEELVRVTRPGGVVFLSYTVWWGPWGGHETAPWHYLGGARAARRYRRRYGREPKNRFGTSLFAVTARDGIAWASSAPGVGLVAAIPRYAPTWAHGVVRVPVLREVLTWNLLLVLRVT